MSTATHADRVAIVTGGASGIGRATAQRLAAEGARVCVADLDRPGAESVAKEIAEAGGEAFACAVDVADVSANAEMVEQTLTRYGALHVVHLNAGVARFSSIVDGDVDIWKQVIDINLSGVFYGLRAVARPIAEAGGGAVVATASVAGLRGVLGLPCRRGRAGDGGRGMGIRDRYLAYADAFEESFVDDEWGRIEAFFTEDAVYEGDPDARGRDAVLAKLKDGIDKFDRRMDSRTLDFQEPTVEGDTLRVTWEVTYAKAGAPDLSIAGVETAVFEGDRIARLRDQITPVAQKGMEQWLAKHAALLQP
jgi:NAD(P)-dependent dehydrogenase (short-subunit alcohol dehydrogenase family)